jgi:hypothetical protein
LRKRFASDEKVEGYQKDGPVAVTEFELGESNEEAIKESRILRQREVSHVIEQLLEILNWNENELIPDGEPFSGFGKTTSMY